MMSRTVFLILVLPPLVAMLLVAYLIRVTPQATWSPYRSLWECLQFELTRARCEELGHR